MKFFFQVLFLAIVLSALIFFITLSIIEPMDFDVASDRGLVMLGAISYFAGLLLSLIAFPASFVGLVLGRKRKAGITWPILAGIAGVIFVLCLFVVPSVQSMRERGKAELEMMK